MMKSKDYELIARVLKIGKYLFALPSQQTAIEGITEAFCDQLENEYENFNEETFKKACRYEED